jgi:hypothetical protein
MAYLKNGRTGLICSIQPVYKQKTDAQSPEEERNSSPMVV